MRSGWRRPSRIARPTSASWRCPTSHAGDLYRALGQGEQARQSYLQSLAIAERLAQAEPDRADYQRQLAVSYDQAGDLYRDLGHGEQARQYHLQSLAIGERLAKAEPDRADYQRVLSASYTKWGTSTAIWARASRRASPICSRWPLGSGWRTPSRIGPITSATCVVLQQDGRPLPRSGTGRAGAHSFQEALAIAERLAQAEPDRADYQRDLSVSYELVGDLYHDLGRGEQARQSYLQSLAIRERLAQAEPDRADYQRDLWWLAYGGSGTSRILSPTSVARLSLPRRSTRQGECHPQMSRSCCVLRETIASRTQECGGTGLLACQSERSSDSSSPLCASFSSAAKEASGKPVSPPPPACNSRASAIARWS